MRVLVDAWLEVLRRQLALARERGEPEDIHDLRVATRRLSSWLRLGGRHALRADLKWLRRAAGAVRDVDVVLTMSPAAPWARWLRRERGERYGDLVRVIESERTTAIVTSLSCAPPIAGRLARRNVGRLATRTLRAGDELDASGDDVERFHALRRAVRSLRYGLEWLDEKTTAFRDFQDLSGVAADLALALRLLDRFPAASTLATERADLADSFHRERLNAIETWQPLRDRVAHLAG